MSFSKKVKEELLKVIPKSRHCMVAELAGIITLHGIDSLEPDSSDGLDRKVFTLLNKTLNIGKDVTTINGDVLFETRKMLKLSEDDTSVDEIVLQQPCCKRAFIRGAFLAAGSITDPNKGYHFEIVCIDDKQADLLIKAMGAFEVEAKQVERNGKIVVYLKEGAQIVEALRIMEAAHSVMELENIRIVKEVRGTINRKVNCETANISKTVSAAVRQIEDIKLIDEKLGLDTLPVQLQEIAQIRLDYPDTPLGDLGQYLDPPIGKSGVNHRLKKLAAIAREFR
ncbi:DNA-binding protein WhiA [Pseudobutyrivibrio sp.]|uniref:DNA-binding protein WhiA n=1 Tax=Pseudobutyrivibrio sp. TaxID=2014367 RepID=UPI001B613CFC|nr:DNA-binding protein WhiA [Pseudobutyrivibrio sp.]MBP5594910.1 DNA-binding protein WhiA [Pseudobutyrivibrio sp.]MBR5649209.1 DNA-binding protein WhiA [Pseudobutyrivibrio sp.]